MTKATRDAIVAKERAMDMGIFHNGTKDLGAYHLDDADSLNYITHWEWKRAKAPKTTVFIGH